MIEVEQGYRYAAMSSFDQARSSLDLATSGGRTVTGPAAHPQFFSGFFTSPAVAAEGLRAVARVAATRYLDLPRPTSRSTVSDPVVTSDGERLRFESFSACGGVYARLDVLSTGMDGLVRDRGTTNVDINEPLRRLLAGVSPDGVLHVAVGVDELVISDADATIVERRVSLPERWLRGFAESQQIASGFDSRLELSAVEATRFLRTVSDARATGWVLPAGRSVRMSGRPSPQAVYLGDGRRLESLLPLLRFATRISAHGPVVTAGAAACCSGWEVDLPGMRFVLLLSPSARRGFSGEGSVLEKLADDDAADDADLVHAALSFQPRLEIADLAETVGVSATRVRAALSCLATAGQVGYDLSDAEYFHRELPYDALAVESMNPRLRAARDLVASNAVHIVDDAIAEVSSGEKRHRVRRTATGTNCTCTWWTSHRGTRGPCKHVLAVRIQRNRQSQEARAHADDSAGMAADPAPDRTT